MTNTNECVSVWSGDVWSKSPNSQKIVPRNHISKSFEGKQFINVRSGQDILSAAIAWSKLMKLGVLFPFYCHFLPESFHTLKIESDFYSRQGHWTLYWTGVYNSILLLKKQRRSSFLFFLENAILSFFVVSLCWNIFLSFLHRKEMLIYFKRCCDDIKYRLQSKKKKQKSCKRTIVVGTLKQSWFFLFSAVYMYFTFTKIYSLL